MHASSTADDQPGAGGIEDGKEGEEGGVDGEGEPLGASPSSSSEGEAGDAGESGDAAASAPAAEEEEEEKQKEEEKTKKKRASSSALPPTEDDVAPALEGDWRDFRAMLVSQEAGPETSTSRDEDSTKLAPSENMELLQRQNPKLASEKAWAHVIGAPERGCLLLASDDEFKQGQQYFHQSVILLLEHHDKGSMGVILNRPTQYNMGYVSGDASGPFADNKLYFGGDVGDGTVSFLHGSEQVTGSAEVLPGVYLGGYDSAVELVRGGEIVAKDFKFFARYCGWGPGQLERECARGVWYPVACSKQLALKQVIQLPKPLWREVLELCGGDLQAASKKAYGELEEDEEEGDAQSP